MKALLRLNKDFSSLTIISYRVRKQLKKTSKVAKFVYRSFNIAKGTNYLAQLFG